MFLNKIQYIRVYSFCNSTLTNKATRVNTTYNPIISIISVNRRTAIAGSTIYIMFECVFLPFIKFHEVSCISITFSCWLYNSIFCFYFNHIITIFYKHRVKSSFQLNFQHFHVYIFHLAGTEIKTGGTFLGSSCFMF